MAISSRRSEAGDPGARSWRRVGSVVVALGATLAACGSSGPQSSASVHTAITGTPATTTARTTTAGTTIAATTPTPVTVIVTVVVTSAMTEPAIDAPTVPAAPTQAPPTQSKPKATAPKTSPQTAAPATIPALYAEVSPPTPPKNNTSDVPDNASLPNGVYWVDYTGGEKDTPSMRVQQAFFGDACVTKAAQTAQTCDGGLFVPSSPDRETSLPFATNVKMTVSDQRTKKSYRITPDELVRIRASSPSDGAPDGYGFTNFRFLMTFSGGKITKFEQLWTVN